MHQDVIQSSGSENARPNAKKNEMLTKHFWGNDFVKTHKYNFCAIICQFPLQKFRIQAKFQSTLFDRKIRSYHYYYYL